MKKLKPGFAGRCIVGFVILWAVFGRAQTGPLSSLAAIHALTNEQASLALPVAFQATVTYYRKGDMDLFVQDGQTAIYVEASTTTKVSAGDRVLVVGHTQASFRPEIKADNVTVVGHDVLPAPVPATFKQLIHAQLDCKRVTVHALVRGVNSLTTGGLKYLYLNLLMDGGYVDVQVAEAGTKNLDNLLDAEVEVTGAVAGKFDSKMQLAGILLEVPSASDIHVLKLGPSSPASLPLTPMDQILASTDIQDHTQRVRVSGTITYYQPGSALVLQDGTKSLWINTLFEKSLRLGGRVSVSGFPDVDNGSIILTQGEIQDSGLSSPIPPVPVTSKELSSGTRALELVSIEGRLLMSLRQSAQDEYVVVSDRHLFSAIYRHPERNLETLLPPMKQVPLGSQVRITGICVLDRGEQFRGSQAFNILLRSPDDIALVAGPSPLNVRNLILLVGILLTALVLIGARGWAIERRLRHKTAELARVAQWRSQILEDINSSTSLVHTLGEIVQMVSFRLSGAPCWCTLADGTQVGNRPALSAGQGVIDYRIASRPGAPLGTISLAIGASAKTEELEKDFLPTAAGLAFLAIETDRLHSDLRYRSEFDLLTDTHNRFSLEKRLDQLLESAKSGAFSFALIYIDLDGFKLVNDSYGHNVGDLYLREAVSRMKAQLRLGDMLARVGGDEFAVLVSRITHVDGAKEVVRRLQHCFDAPFDVDGRRVTGSASFGISICPRDGLTKDSVLKAADTAMYAAKAARRTASSPRASEDRSLSPQTAATPSR
jgi:diguanylate cyclase (GGDEF)-like protein